jgi:hypothetical protein
MPRLSACAGYVPFFVSLFSRSWQHHICCSSNPSFVVAVDVTTIWCGVSRDVVASVWFFHDQSLSVALSFAPSPEQPTTQIPKLPQAHFFPQLPSFLWKQSIWRERKGRWGGREVCVCLLVVNVTAFWYNWRAGVSGSTWPSKSSLCLARSSNGGGSEE